jgi:hypothetical protein
MNASNRIKPRALILTSFLVRSIRLASMTQYVVPRAQIYCGINLDWNYEEPISIPFKRCCGSMTLNKKKPQYPVQNSRRQQRNDNDLHVPTSSNAITNSRRWNKYPPPTRIICRIPIPRAKIRPPPRRPE